MLAAVGQEQGNNRNGFSQKSPVYKILLMKKFKRCTNRVHMTERIETRQLI